MSGKIPSQYKVFLRSCMTTFYYVMYGLVTFLIVIGEVTTIVVIFPVKVSLILSIFVLDFAKALISDVEMLFRKLLDRKEKLYLPEGEIRKSNPSEKPILNRSIILHPTASRRVNYAIFFTKLISHFYNDVNTSIGYIFPWGYKVIRTSLLAFDSLVMYIWKKVLTVIKSSKDLIILFSHGILVSQILAVAVKRWIVSLFAFIIYMILLPWRLARLSVTSSFRFFYIGFFVCLLGIVAYQSYIFIENLPSPHNLGKINYPLSTHIFDRNGRLLYEVYRDQNRTPIKLADLPPHIAQASVAIEDKDFYHHNGISVFGGMLRALKDTYKTNELQGGSTITQQLIKTALLSPERTIERKLKEVILAVWAERIYTKNQIMEMYLNQIPYGGSAYGIQEASRTFFGKDARQLTIGEAAMLAGLTRAPSVYSPFVNPGLAQKRRNEVLEKMYELNFITEKQKREEQTVQLAVREPRTTIRAPHFVFYTKSFLESEYGIKEVEEGGLRVITSLDLEIQQEAEKILREELEKVSYLNVTNGGIVVSDPATGEILAMVGSKDYFESPYGAFNVATALRQPGSSLKPLLYSLAMEKGYTAATIIDDSPITFTISQTEVYKPVNYDGAFHGKVPVRIALANSYNIPAVRILNTFGVQNYVDHARRMGIDTWNDSTRFGLSLSLGGGEATLIDITEAYGVFANRGYRVNLTPIKQLSNTDRDLLAVINPAKEKVLDDGVAFIISDILSDNNARQAAFGRGSALEIPGYQVAVKTGTTDHKKDNLTIGYTPEFVVSVWVGNNDNTPMNPYLASGITGAAPIWSRVMTYLLKNKSNLGTKVAFTKPEHVVQSRCFGRSEYFVAGTQANVFCQPTTIKPQAKDGDNNRRTP